jgi:type III secretion protein V
VGEFLVNDTVERLKLLNIHNARPAINPANGNECAIIEEADYTRAVQAGLTAWGPRGYLVICLSAEIRRLAGSFLNMELVEHNLNLLEEYYPRLIGNFRKKFRPPLRTAILRYLLDEEISIRDLRSILETLLKMEGAMTADLARYIIFSPPSQELFLDSRPVKFETLTAPDYANQVRESLKKYISHKYTRGQNTLVVYLLDPQLETLLRNSADKPLAKEDHDKILGAVRAEFKYYLPPAPPPVILTTGDIRKTMQKLLEKEMPRLAVLAYTELSPDMNIQPVARISL